MSSAVILASRGNMESLSHSCSGKSSASERRELIPLCVWAFLKPGISKLPAQSMDESHLPSKGRHGCDCNVWRTSTIRSFSTITSPKNTSSPGFIVRIRAL